MATIHDVASAAGVSPSVVSRVLNNDQSLRVRPETRERVLSASRRLQYVANGTARALRMAQAHAFWLVVHDLSNPLYAETIRGAQQAAKLAGYVLLLGDAGELDEQLGALHELLRGRRIDGVLLQRKTNTSDRSLAKLARAAVPTVLLDDAMRDGLSAVRTDGAAAARLGVQHLIDLGHQRIGHLKGARSFRADDRHRGYLEALREAGIACVPSAVAVGGWDAESGRAGLIRLMSRPNPPTAIFVSNGLAALGALAAARDMGIAVPKDLSLVSLHDTWLADVVSPRLTTVRVPQREMGRRAVELLIEQLSNPATREVCVDTTPPEIMIRESTAPPSSPARP